MLLKRCQFATLLIAGLVVTNARAQLIGTWPTPATPAGNPTFAATGNINDLHRELLGKLLFWDEQLSTDRTRSCGTCHDPLTGGNDKNGGVRHRGFDNIFGNADDTFGSPGVVRSDTNRDFRPAQDVGVGLQVTGLNAPTMIGAAFFEKLFWDKRADSAFRDLNNLIVPNFTNNAALESQAAGPPVSDVEMGHDNPITGPHVQWAEIESKLGALFPLALATNIPPTFAVVPGADYDQLFTVVFGAGSITRENISIAIAAYMRTLIPDQAPVDLGTMTPDQVAGLNLFRTRGCARCHSNGGSIQFNPSTQTFSDPNDLLFSDGLAHNIQLVNHNSFPANFPDDGFGIGVKTPTLRNVGLRKRLFHSGHVTSVTQAMILHYNNPSTPPIFRFNPLLSTTALPGQTSEFDQVVDFLDNALTDPRVAAGVVPFDFPTLRGDIAPFGGNLIGPGSPGTNNLIPKMIANAPTRLANDEWRIGLGDALPGSIAALFFAPALQPGQIINGIPLELDTSSMIDLGSFPVDPDGTITIHQPVPSDPALIGLQLNWQWFVADPAAAGNAAATSAAQHTIF